MWESFHFGFYNNQTVKQVSENLAELSEHIEVVLFKPLLWECDKTWTRPWTRLESTHKIINLCVIFSKSCFLIFVNLPLLIQWGALGFEILTIKKLCDLLLLVPCQLLFAQAHMILFVWTYMISSLQVYDASGSLIPCQVNPVMTSEGISSSKYEVKSP